MDLEPVAFEEHSTNLGLVGWCYEIHSSLAAAERREEVIVAAGTCLSDKDVYGSR